MTAGAHDEFDLALVETHYRDAIRSLVAATGLAATYQDERDHALAEVERLRNLCLSLIDIHNEVHMDTPEDQALHAKVISNFRVWVKDPTDTKSQQK